jgi:3-polyprenyl-4-hydroxybenzoate decarboxylase
MAYESLRAFVEKLEAAGELKRIPAEGDPVLEITEIADREMKSSGSPSTSSTGSWQAGSGQASLGGKALLFEKCQTNDLEVPADCDFVLEGYVEPNEPLEMEGPFGDHTGYYKLPEPYPKFHVERITHRREAIYPSTIVDLLRKLSDRR